MIEIRNICKTYAGKKGSPPVKALDDVSIRFEDTGMVFILGKSGSGKSTLLNVLGGLDRYDSGEFIIKGKSSKDFSQSDFDSYRNTFIGFIFQEYNVLDEFTVGANIALAMELQGKKATKEALNDILGQVDLLNFASRKPNTLSGGQKQRVAIARALIKSPEIIMADEPTGALDSNTGKQVFDTLKKLSETKLVIVVSHDREFAEQYGDRVIEFSDGKIVSDITKYKAAPESVNDGVHIIDDKIIHIKKGYTLTPADLKMINTYLATSETDTIISTDAKSNADFKRVARIDDEGQKESFADTTDKDVKVKDYDPGAFKLIRSRLPIKNSIKIGASSLKAKPVRLVFTILLCFIAFTLFGLADTMAAYNKFTNARTSIVDTQIKTATLTKRQLRGEGQYSYFFDTMLGEQDFVDLKAKTGLDFVPLYNGLTYSGGSIPFSRHIADSTKLIGANGSDYYKGSFTGFAALSEAQLSDMNGSLQSGAMPVAEDELAVSRYIYEHFVLGGFNGTNALGEAVTIDAKDVKPENIVGQYLEMNVGDRMRRMKICGIFDSNMDARYDSLKPSDVPKDDNELNAMVTGRMFGSEIQYGLHAVGVVSPSGMTALSSREDQLGQRLDQVGWIQLQKNDDYMSPQRIATLDQAEQGGANVLFWSGKTSVGQNEMLTSYGSLQQMFMRSGDGFVSLEAQDQNFEFVENPWGTQLYNQNEMPLYDFLQMRIWVGRAAWEHAKAATLPGKAFSDYVMANKKAFEYYEETPPADEKLRVLYAYYLTQPRLGEEGTGIDGGLLENAFGNETGYSLGQQMFEKMFVRYQGQLGSLNFQRTTQHYNAEKGEERDAVTITGCLLPSAASVKAFMEREKIFDLGAALDSLYRDVYVCSDDYYRSFGEGETGIYAMALAPMPLNDKAKLDTLLELHYDESGTVAYKLNNSVSMMLGMAESMIETMATVFLWVGVGFALFAALMMFNFIATSITYKKREIGILRAVGAKSSDVFGIFFNESLIITIINYVLAVIATIVAVIVINGVLRTEVGLVITLLHFGIRQLALMLGVSVLVAFIASFLPVYRISKKRPIDAIRGE